METKDLREGINGKGPDVINVTLVGTFFWSIVQTTGGEPENEDQNQHYLRVWLQELQEVQIH